MATNDANMNIDELFAEFSKFTQKGTCKHRDEFYVIDLCDEVLASKASRQHKFDFLRGDPSSNNKRGVELPVDAYYKDLNLVVEYNECQHTESVVLFDNKKTISGVSRGEQRRIYDERRQEVLPKHGIDLVVISYFDFGGSKKLKRNHDHDIQIVRNKLQKYIDK